MILAALVFYVAVVSLKLLIASNLDLFYDEATYWQASLRPAFGYTQAPFMTPFLIRVGTFIFGDTLFGVRSIHLMMAAAIPLAVYLLARQFTDRHDAALAGGASLIMPITGLLGEAHMEAPMILFMVLALAALAHARRTHKLSAWLMVGVLCALGLATHYRFAPFGLGVLAYLLFTRDGRGMLATKGPWVAGAIAALGALPLIIFNLNSGMASFQFQVVDRNPWTFQAKGLLFAVEQFAVVTPFLFIALAGIVVRGLRNVRRASEGEVLLVTVSVVYVGFYAVLAPFSDLERVHVHWPAAGYVPLFVLLPGYLRDIATTRARRVFCWMVPVTGAVVVVGGLYYLAAAAWPATLFPEFLYRYKQHDLVKWSDLKAPVTAHLNEHFDGPRERVILAASNYTTAAELDFLLRPQDGVYVLAHRKNVREGISRQYGIWKLDEASMRRDHAGAEALFVVEDKHYWFESPEEVLWRAGLCDVFRDIRYLGAYELVGGRKSFLMYAARVRVSGERSGVAPGPGNCATLPSAYLTRPTRGEVLKGVVAVYGWAVDDPAGVRTVETVVDGKVIAVSSLEYDDARVLELMPGSTDPHHPRIGFRHEWDTGALPEGEHTVEIRVHSTDGKIRTFGRRTVHVVHN